MELTQLQHRTYIMDSANLENYAWIYVREDDWDQGGVFLEIWFLADYDIQIWTNFDSFANTYYQKLLSVQKFHFPVEVVFNSLPTKKGLELVFRSQVFVEFFSFVIWHKLTKFINVMYSLPKLFSKIYFLFYA